MEVNYLGAVNCIHPALAHLKTSKGTIVAISSLQGEIAIPHHTGYSASKHALNGFLESLELETGDSVRILCVMPGWITGTNLRANSFQAGNRKGGNAARGGAASVSVEECSGLVVRAMRGKTRTLFIPGKLKVLLWLRTLAPSLLKLLIRRAVHDQERH
jgi:short-subunit dehydrogenase